jgi:hypothetical protein
MLEQNKSGRAQLLTCADPGTVEQNTVVFPGSAIVDEYAVIGISIVATTKINKNLFIKNRPLRDGREVRKIIVLNDPAGLWVTPVV